MAYTAYRKTFLFWNVAENKNVIKTFIWLDTIIKQNFNFHPSGIPGFTLCQGGVSEQVTGLLSPVTSQLTTHNHISLLLNKSGITKDNV
jgi:hypothetical protein